MKVPKVFVSGNKNFKTRSPRIFKRLDKIVREEYKHVDVQIKKKKEEIEYLAEITEKYWNKLVKIFDPNNKICPDILDRVFFDRIKNVIEHIEKSYSTLGLATYHGNLQDMKYPEVLLGWVSVQQTASGVYTLCLTSEGTEILDRLKEIRKQ